MPAIRDDQGYRISLTRTRKGVKVNCHAYGWFYLDEENLARLEKRIAELRIVSIEAPKNVR